MVNNVMLGTAPGRERLQSNVKGKSTALPAPHDAPAQECTSWLGLQGDGAAAASASSKKHGEPYTSVNRPHTTYHGPTAPKQPQDSWLTMGIPSTPQSRGALTPLGAGLGRTPLKHWKPPGCHTEGGSPAQQGFSS